MQKKNVTRRSSFRQTLFSNRVTTDIADRVKNARATRQLTLLYQTLTQSLQSLHQAQLSQAQLDQFFDSIRNS